MTTCFNACMLMVNCFPHALSGLKHVADFFFQSTDLLNHCENIESSVAYIYSWIYVYVWIINLLHLSKKKTHMNFNFILQQCIHAVSLIYIPFFLKMENEGYECSVKRIKELTKKSVSAIAHVPHTLYQIQSYAETRCCQDFGNLPRDRSKHMQILNSS